MGFILETIGLQEILIGFVFLILLGIFLSYFLRNKGNNSDEH